MIFDTHGLMTIFNKCSKFQIDLMNIQGDMASQIVSLSKSTYFCTHTKRNSYSLCSQLGGTKIASQFNFPYRYIDDVLSINDTDLRIIWVKCIPLSLRSKTRRRATPLLPTWIYSCRSRVTVSCELPFTTNVTISTSISQIFRSWVAIVHLRHPIVFLSYSTYGMPGLAPLMNLLF